MSAWSLWISGVSVYEGNAINVWHPVQSDYTIVIFHFSPSDNLKCSLM